MSRHIRVSVVVPVYNPGRHIDALVQSLIGQTLPAESFEIIFSDDGCTDDTPERLDKLAAEHDNVRVLHEPNSGWPGRPRNLGMDIASGDYVFFVDQDDWLGREALQRMCDFADANQSDVVIGRYAGHHRGVAKAPFRRTRPDASLQNTPLMDSLTPHKMFRTEFLRHNAIRFPEGRRRLEDHVFVVTAYFLAERISVLADYHVYFHVGRDDAGNAGFQRIDPAGYYANVREVVDIVLAHTEPGTVRDRCLRRSLRTELLGRLDGKSFLDQDSAYQRALFDQARQLAESTMPLSVDAGLSPPQRVRAFLLRADRLEDLKQCVSHYLDTRPVARLTELRWTADGSLLVEVDSTMVDRNTGEPWRYDLEGEAPEQRTYLSAPSNLRGPFPREAADCTGQLDRASVEIVLRRRADSEEWPVPTEATATVHRDGAQAWATIRGSARIDPRVLGGGEPLSSGVWDVFARVSVTGWTKDARLGADRTDAASSGRRPALLAGQVIRPYWTKPHDNLSIDVGADLTRVLRDETGSVTLARRDGGARHLHVAAGLVVPVDDLAALSVHLTSAGRELSVAANAVRGPDDTVTAVAELPELDAGTWQVALQFAPGRRGTTRSALSVSPAGEVSVVANAGSPPPKPAPAPKKAERTATTKPHLARRLRRKWRALTGR